MNRFFDFIGSHAKFVIIILLLITAVFAYFAVKVEINASFSAFIPWGEYTDYFEGGVEGQKPDLGTEKASNAPVVYPEKPNSNTDDYRIAAVDIAYSEVVDVRNLPPVEEQEGPNYSYGTTYLVLVEADDLFTAKKLNLVDYVINQIENLPEITYVSSVLDYITLEKKGSRLAISPINSKSGEYWTEEEAALLKERIDRDPIIKYFLVGGNNPSLVFQCGISNVGIERNAEIDSYFDLLKENGIEVYLSGGSVINNKVLEYLYKDLILLVALCLIVILIVYYLSFRTLRSVLIPASLSIMALIWTFGTMSICGISLNILNIVTPCMVLTLGSAYSMHVLSEYYAKHREKKDISAVDSTRGIIRTIIYACVTTVFGFLCLLISKTDGLKEFGISVSFGISYCAILACIYIPAIFSIIKAPKDKELKKYENGLMGHIVKAIANFAVKFHYVLLIILIIIILGFVFTNDKINVNSNYMSYFPPSDEFGRMSKHFAAEMGGATPYTIKIEAPEGETNFFLKSENLAMIREYEEALLSEPDILQIVSFAQYICYANDIMTGDSSIPESNGLLNMISRLIIMMKGQVGSIANIISDDGNTLTLTVQHWDGYERDLMTASSITRTYSAIVRNLSLLPKGTSVSVSGDPLPNIKFSNRIIEDQNKSTYLSLAIVFLFAWLTSKSLRQGLLTMVPVISGIMMNYIFMYFAGIPFDIVTVCFSSIAIGCGVDNALHFMIRARNKKKENLNLECREIIKYTIVETGRPIILSTLSIVCGMMMLSFASYTPIRYFGLLMSFTLLSCMLSTIFILPSVAIFVDDIKSKLRKSNNA